MILTDKLIANVDEFNYLGTKITNGDDIHETITGIKEKKNRKKITIWYVKLNMAIINTQQEHQNMILLK